MDFDEDEFRSFVDKFESPFVDDPGAKLQQVPLGTFKNILLDEGMSLLNDGVTSAHANGGSLPPKKGWFYGTFLSGSGKASAQDYSVGRKRLALKRIGLPQASLLNNYSYGKKTPFHPFGLCGEQRGKVKPYLTVEKAVALAISDPRFTPYLGNMRSLEKEMAIHYICPTAPCFTYMKRGSSHPEMNPSEDLEPEPVATGPMAGANPTHHGRDYLARASPMIERSFEILEGVRHQNGRILDVHDAIRVQNDAIRIQNDAILFQNGATRIQNDGMIGVGQEILTQNNESLAALRGIQDAILEGVPAAQKQQQGHALLATFDAVAEVGEVGHRARIEELDEPEYLDFEELDNPESGQENQAPKSLTKKETKLARKEKNAKIRARLQAENATAKKPASKKVVAKKANGKPPKTPATKGGAASRKKTTPAPVQEPATPRSSGRIRKPPSK